MNLPIGKVASLCCGVSTVNAIAGKAAVFLLCGGSKRTQASNIRTAVNFWWDYQQRLQ